MPVALRPGAVAANGRVPVVVAIGHTALGAVAGVVVLQIRLAHQLEVGRVGESGRQQACTLVGDDVSATVPPCDTAINEPPLATLRSEFDMGGRTPQTGHRGSTRNALGSCIYLTSSVILPPTCQLGGTVEHGLQRPAGTLQDCGEKPRPELGVMACRGGQTDEDGHLGARRVAELGTSGTRSPSGGSLTS